MTKGTLHNCFLFLLGAVVLGQIFTYYYSGNIQIVLLLLTVLTVLFGGLIIFRNSNEMVESLERTRALEIDEKSRWRNGYIIALCIIVLGGFVFRFIHINETGINFDEYWALIEAMGTQHHGAANYVISGHLTFDDPRFSYALWAVGWLFSIFGKSLLVARLPGIVMSALTAVPLYFLLSRRVNKLAGLTAAVLWLMSPWAIVVGRFFREYAYFPFYYVFIFIMLIWLAEYVIGIIRKEKRAEIFKIIFGIMAFIAPLIYALVLATNTTFKLVIIPYAIGIAYFFYLLLSSRKKSLNPNKLQIFFGFLLLILVVAGFAKLLTVITFAVNLKPRFNAEQIKLAFENGPRNWFYPTGSFTYYILLGLGILGSAAMTLQRKMRTVFFTSLIFLSYIYAFTFHFDYSIAARYTFPIHLWSIPILAVSLQIIYWILRGIKEKWKRFLANVLFFLTVLFTFNPVNTYNAINAGGSRHDLISGETLYFDEFDSVLRNYGSELKNSAILCWRCPQLYWFEIVDLTQNNVGRFNLNLENGVDSVKDFMDKNEHGWVIFDGGSYKFKLLREYGTTKTNEVSGAADRSFEFEGKKLQYVDEANEDYLYRW